MNITRKWHLIIEWSIIIKLFLKKGYISRLIWKANFLLFIFKPRQTLLMHVYGCNFDNALEWANILTKYLMNWCCNLHLALYFKFVRLERLGSFKLVHTTHMFLLKFHRHLFVLLMCKFGVEKKKNALQLWKLKKPYYSTYWTTFFYIPTECFIKGKLTYWRIYYISKPPLNHTTKKCWTTTLMQIWSI